MKGISCFPSKSKPQALPARLKDNKAVANKIYNDNKMDKKSGLINILIFLTFVFISTNVSAKKKTSPPSLKFKVNQQEFLIGDTCIASWNSTIVKSIQFSIVTISPTGEKTVKDSIIENSGCFFYIPKQNVQLKFIFNIGKKKPNKKNINIELLYPEISFFRVSRDSINNETGITLNWSANNVSHVRINNLKDRLDANDNIVLRPDSTTIYKIFAVNKNGYSIDTSLKVKVTPIEFCNIPKSCFKGEKNVINWEYKYCDSIRTSLQPTIFKGIDKLEFIMPSKNITVNFNIYRSSGKIDTISRLITYKEPIIKYISAPNSILRGSDVLIQWDCEGCSYITVSGVDKKFGRKGSYLSKPYENKTYGLIFYDLYGEIFQTKNIEVEVAKGRTFVKNIVNIDDIDKNIRVDCEIVGIDYYHFPNEITLKVIAVDTSGNFVSGIMSKHKQAVFTSLVENMEGVGSMQINNFKITEVSKETPYSISVIIDYSGSICNEVRDIDLSFKKFVQNKRPNDKISLIKFDHQITYASPYFYDKDSIMEFYHKFKYSDFGGSTALYAAIDKAYKSINLDTTNNNVIIVLTDGNENSSMLYIDSLDCDPNSIVFKSRENKIKIITVGFGNGVNESVLRALSHLTGSNNYQISRPKDILDVFQEIPIIANRYYEIRYKPISKNGTHNVLLNYNNHAGRVVNTTSDYCTDNSYYIQDYEGELMKKYDTLLVRIMKKSNLKCKPINIENAKYLKELKPLWVSPPQLLAQYKTNKSILDTIQFNIALTNVAQLMNKDSTCCIILLGHTDTRGSILECNILSKQRAEIVKKFLIEKGIAEDRILVYGCGKSLSIWDNDKKEKYAKENRRVEYILIK